jgi:glucoamylase
MRDLPLGNGSLLVNFDNKYQIRDIYFPHVGQENHTCGFPFRLGVWVEGAFSWTFEDEWDRRLEYEPDALVTDVTLTNHRLGIRINCHDTVARNLNVFVRHVEVTDGSGSERSIRVYLHQDFRLYENKIGDTAFFDPASRAVIHYKKHRYFLINSWPHFDEFATGRKDFRHQEGTWRDAEDGSLHRGAITEGSVDSTVAIHGTGSFSFYFWIAAGTSLSEVRELDRSVKDLKPESLFSERRRADGEWLAKGKEQLEGLPDAVSQLYRRSLLIAATQIDAGGAIVAATDSEVTDRATDHYAYLWPRDGAFIANAFDQAGYPEFGRQFLLLCKDIIDERGYFLQKYNADGSLGSGWHALWDPWREKELIPIQEDETALVLWSAWQHYELSGDLDLARELYDGLVVKAADLLERYRDDSTGLPLPSWNLWEDRRGVHTFTCSTVVAGLRAGAGFARLFGDDERAERYSAAAKGIVAGMREHLFVEPLGRFIRGLLVADDDALAQDLAIDASLFAAFYFDCFEPDDPMVVGTMKAIEKSLYVSDGIRGVARYERDDYMRVSEKAPGNPWIICTLWLAEYYIAAAKTEPDLGPALELIEWVTRLALPSGVLAEQAHPETGEPLSVSPLTWSHSSFIATVCSYQAKLRELRAN